MDETTCTTSQSMYKTFCHFLKRLVYPGTSGELEPSTNSSIPLLNIASKSFEESRFDDDEYLVLTSLAQNTASNHSLQRYEPLFTSRVRLRIFAANLSPWHFALKKRLLEKICCREPFIRYDIRFVSDELEQLRLRRSNEKCVGEEDLNSVDENGNERCSSTRSPSPCRSNSTSSSAYSSGEVSSTSSASQYSCSFTSESFSQEEGTSNEVYIDTHPNVFHELIPYNTETNNYCSLKPENNVTSFFKNNEEVVDDARLRGFVERAFKYSKLFEILEHSCNRFRISPSSCGLGLPLTHLDRCWPSVNAVGKVKHEDSRYFRRSISSSVIKKKKRGSCLDATEGQSDDAVIIDEFAEGSSLCYIPASNSYDQDSFCVSGMDVLSEEIWDYHMSVTQSEEVLNLKMQLRDVLFCALSQLFPMCGLYVVGSSLNGFGTNSSDMDLCLMISCKEINQRTDAVVVLDLVRSLFKNMSLIKEQHLIIAKVPILRIKFHEPYSKIVVDLNANNSVAIRNTQLLCYYSYYDWRVRPLVSVVKEWAKRRDINDANRSSFTSYSLVLMVIHYLQCEAKLLPSLQEKYPKIFNQRVDVRTLSVSLPLESQGFCPKTFDCRDRPTLGELLLGFFEYYAKKFDYGRDAISIRLGRKAERHLIANQLYSYNGRMSQWNCICIEEPFNYSNTAHSVHDQNVFDQIRFALTEDYYKLEQTRDLHAFLDVDPLTHCYCSVQSCLSTGCSETLISAKTERISASTLKDFADCQCSPANTFKAKDGNVGCVDD